MSLHSRHKRRSGCNRVINSFLIQRRIIPHAPFLFRPRRVEGTSTSTASNLKAKPISLDLSTKDY